MGENLNTNALFLGSKGENSELFEKLLTEAFQDHVFWRRNFHPEDPLSLTRSEKRSESYEVTVDSFTSKFHELLARLKHSVPFNSPRYLAHMISDTLMPAMLGYISTMLYNPNNVCYEASTVTAEFEVEVGKQLAEMMSFDPERSWAHLTSGGTVANIESVWVIRNLKYFPLIASCILRTHNRSLMVKSANGSDVDLASIEDDHKLLSFPPESLSDLVVNFFNLDWEDGIEQEVFQHRRNISHSGMQGVPIGKVLVPASKHYSWPKAGEILGIGRSNIVSVKVDSNFRMDINDLRTKLEQFHQESIPIIAVVGVVGSTEGGSIDPIDQIVSTRQWYEETYDSSFHIHIDAAYGGYARSIFINSDNGEIRPLKEIRKEFSHHTLEWPCQKVYDAFVAVSEADAVTIDPHKLGYIPYPAGAIIFKDKNAKPATLCKAPYINNTTQGDNDDVYIGSYILEGSKPGAAAAACWLAHKVVPLNQDGYGQIISEPIGNALELYDILNDCYPLKVNDKTVSLKLLCPPDLDLLLYVFNVDGNSSLEEMNQFNKELLDKFSFHMDKSTGSHDYFLSSTSLSYDIYDEAISPALEELGINLADWREDKTSMLTIRSTVSTPLVSHDDLKEFYWQGFSKALSTAIAEIIDK